MRLKLSIKLVGPKTTLIRPPTPPILVFTTFKVDAKRPTDGKVALHVESGVATTKRQLDNSNGKVFTRGSTTKENTPDPFVIALDTTFPVPHLNCTVALEKTPGVSPLMTSKLPLTLQSTTPLIRIETTWAIAAGVAINATKRKIEKIFAKAMVVILICDS